MTMTKPRLGERVLLVDDMVDSGHTLQAVHAGTAAPLPHIVEPQDRRAVVEGDARCSSPITAVDYLPDNPWIHQPFEVYDTLRPVELRALPRRPVESRRRADRRRLGPTPDD